MNQKILNFIIFVSLSGILIVSIRDYYNGKRSSNEKKLLSPKPTKIIKNSRNLDELVSCQHRYFNFKKGAYWRYKLLINFPNDKKKKVEVFFTNKIIENLGSSVIIEMELEKKRKQTTIICKNTGVYGFPFPLIIDLLTDNFFTDYQLNKNLLNQGTSFMILPSEERLKNNLDWESWSFLSLFSLKNKVTEEKNQSILNLGTINTLTVNVEPKFNQFFLKPDIFSSSIIYHLGEKIGFLDFSMIANLNRLEKIELFLSLLEFKENNN